MKWTQSDEKSRLIVDYVQLSRSGIGGYGYVMGKVMTQVEGKVGFVLL